MAINLSLYKMSKDYAQLKELLDKGYSVLVKRGENLWLLRRTAGRYPQDGAYYAFSCGDISCQPGIGEKYFAEGCEQLGIEFLPPSA